jgi:hypothetical protein
MFFKKKEDVTARLDVKDNRQESRYNAMAHISITGFDGNALLRNINTAGFCMESKTYVALRPGEQYTMTVSPGDSSRTPPFVLTVEVRWVRNSETSFRAGFKIFHASPDEAFRKYIEYIKTHNRA